MAVPPRVPVEMFRFTTTDRADLRVAVMHAFSEANERLETALSFDDVRERLRAVGWYESLSDDDLDQTLRQLHQWGHLDVIQNHTASYTTAEEYERRNLLYSLTKLGEAAYAGVQHALAVLSSTGALQTAVLDAIADRLAELAELIADAKASDRKIFTALQELEGHLSALRNNTKQFNGQLQRLLRAEGADLATFYEVKTATVAYLQEFVTNLDVRAHTVRAVLRKVDGRGVSVLHQRALLGAELPPGTDGDDPAVPWLEQRQARWDGLRLWFDPPDSSPARIEELHAVARRAIVSLLQALDRITESRRRSSSVVEDLRTLARWFAAAPTEDDLHRLWDVAFGLTSSRHAHLHHDDAELVPATTSWADAPPVPVSALLRSSGRTERFSRTARIRDVSAVRRERQARARKEREELEEARRRLHTHGPIRLSSFGRLDHSRFEHLLDLVGRALSSRADSTGARRGTTSDGRVEVVLRLAADGGVAMLLTPRGAFRSPDMVIDIRPVSRTTRQTLAAVGEAREAR